MRGFAARACGAGLIVIAVCLGRAAKAQDGVFELDLPGGQQIEISRFGSGGEPLVLWLPSERGLRPAHSEHARSLAALGHEVWLADLHSAYFVPLGRGSIASFPLDDVVAIIEHAAAVARNGVILLGSQRGAELVLIAAREWQLKNPGKSLLRGALLLHAHLYEGRPAAGKAARYLPIVAATNLPVYLLDTQYSVRSGRVRDLAAALGSGGSRVYSQVLAGVQGGFHARDDADLSPADRDARAKFSAVISRALTLLQRAPAPSRAVDSRSDTVRFSRVRPGSSALERVERPFTPPPLVLAGYRGQTFDLHASRGRVTLVNFWASWCKPCVDEIPSLHRLDADIEHPGFDIVTVNVGEDRGRIAAFLRRVPIHLPLLLDEDGRVAREWNVYLYPSSFLVDHEGRIQYAYFGAVEWDSAENIEIIRQLLRQI